MIYDILKRILDITAGLVGIILFSPVMFFWYFWIRKYSNEGPVFADVPLRVGKNGKEFKMYKLRSMIPNAHELMLKNPELRRLHQENGYKLDPDPRLIKGGKFIRKTSLDEVPQFINVFLGNMSIVGPRAYYRHEIEEQTQKYPESREYMEQLLIVKPGITGPWQIGGRATLSYIERVKMDAAYAKKRSILYDIFIIIKTPLALISQKGAY